MTITKGDSTYNKLKAFFDARDVPEYIWWAIIRAESGGDTQAVGDGGTSFGLFQIHGDFSASERERLKSDPLYNAQRAYSLWQGRGKPPSDYAASKAKAGTGEYAAYYWIYAQRPQAWTQYNQNGQFNDAMQKVATLAESVGAESSGGVVSPDAETSSAGAAIPDNTQAIINIVAGALGVVALAVVVMKITKGVE